MNSLQLFTDGSVNAQSKIGYGAYLIVRQSDILLDAMKSDIRLKRFEKTSSTKLELQTLIWALNELGEEAQKIVIYTDSQNIIKLPERRYDLERNDFRSKKNAPLNNHELYREFYKLSDKMHFELEKVKGHLPSIQKDRIDNVFTLVDRAARRALKEEN